LRQTQIVLVIKWVFNVGVERGTNRVACIAAACLCASRVVTAWGVVPFAQHWPDILDEHACMEVEHECIARHVLQCMR